MRKTLHVLAKVQLYAGPHVDATLRPRTARERQSPCSMRDVALRRLVRDVPRHAFPGASLSDSVSAPRVLVCSRHSYSIMSAGKHNKPKGISVRSTIKSLFEQVADEQHRKLAPLTDDLKL